MNIVETLLKSLGVGPDQARAAWEQAQAFFAANARLHRQMDQAEQALRAALPAYDARLKRIEERLGMAAPETMMPPQNVVPLLNGEADDRD